MKDYWIKVSLLILTFLFSSEVYSDVKCVGDRIVANHRYIMGDNDSRSDAVALCYLEAKRQAIEYAALS